MNTRAIRAVYREEGNGYYHLCTDGWKENKIFNTRDQFAFGMLMLGVCCVKYPIKLYAFTLMDNHLHLILKGTGAVCLQVFDFLKRKFSQKLEKDACSPLPKDYGFRLVKITSEDQMKKEIVYVLRNCLEKELAIVGGYPWSSAWICHADLADAMTTFPVSSLSQRGLFKLLLGEEALPGDWLMNPYIGLMPTSFVDTSMMKRLFPSPKDLQTALVKDYECFYQISQRLGETVAFSKTEVQGLVNKQLQQRFHAQDLDMLSESERGNLAIILYREYGMTPKQISTAIFLKEKIIRQLITSKELRL